MKKYSWEFKAMPRNTGQHSGGVFWWGSPATVVWKSVASLHFLDYNDILQSLVHLVQEVFHEGVLLGSEEKLANLYLTL